MVVPVYTFLLDHLEKLSVESDRGHTIYTETSFKQDAARAAFDKLNKYYNISSEACTVATVLDPRLKLDFYKDETGNNNEKPEEIRDYVKEIYERDYSKAPTPSKIVETPKDKIFGKFYRSKSNINQSEFSVYISEPVVLCHHNFDILQYWNQNSLRFPNLARMARDYLAIPGTSTPSERAFSGGRQLITDFRCRLAGDTIKACMLLKSWNKFKKGNYFDGQSQLEK